MSDSLKTERYQQRVDNALEKFGIHPDRVRLRELPLCYEAEDLVVADTGREERQFLLIPAAAEAWQSMKAAALEDGVTLYLVSAFRSVERQCELIQAKLERGEKVEAILEVLAVPGYSEHHTGRAIDLLTPGARPLDEAFEQTPAFEWLTSSAQKFGFYLSYPRGNRSGYYYEPWHWCYHGEETQREKNSDSVS